MVTRVPTQIDPRSDEKRSRLRRWGWRAFLLGAFLGVLGAATFVGAPLVDGPAGASLGFAGVFLTAAGGFFALFVAPPLLALAFLGSGLRFLAHETVEVGADVARRRMDLEEELAPREARLAKEIAPDLGAAAEAITHGVARGARSGWEAGKKP